MSFFSGISSVGGYIILTALNDSQAEGNHLQISQKKDATSSRINFAIISSESGTLCSFSKVTSSDLRYICAQEQKEYDWDHFLGKLLNQIPHKLPHGRSFPLLNEFCPVIFSVSLCIREGMMRLFVDALLLFTPLQIDSFSRDAVIIVIKENTQ